MRSRILALLFFVACGQDDQPLPVPGPPGPRLTLNDVSFLFPLPAVGATSELLGLSGAELVPVGVLSGLPELVEGVPQAQVLSELKVVSARIDPCFPGTAPPAAATCVKQVRLVVQPVFTAPEGVTTRDATLHLFYTLSDAAFGQAVQRLFVLDSLAAATTDGPLDVHPVLKQQGLAGPYADTLRSLLLDACSPQTLTRVAFMSVDQQGSTWRFGAFNVVNGALVEDLIPRMPMLKVQAFQEVGSSTFRNGSLIPAAANDSLSVLLSEREMRLTDERSLNKALTSALRIEHPERTSPKTIDCASCHVASRARRNAEAFHRLDSSGHVDRFTAPGFDLTRVDAVNDDPKALRAFGYLGRASAFSQRTINESAAVALALEALRPR